VGSESDEEDIRVVITKEDLLKETLTRNCKLWGDPQMYASQIEKLTEAFGPNRSKSTCGQELEKTIR
jgi:hypothetical protein